MKRMEGTYKSNNISAATYHNYLNWYQIKAETQAFYSVVRYANDLICITCVLMNINKNV